MQCFSHPLPDCGEAFMEVCLRSKAYEFVDHAKRPCILILPGGGYRSLSEREAEPSAISFLRAGYQVCILHYSVRATDEAPFLGNLPLRQACAAVREIRRNAAQWGIDSMRVSVCGFSAGGHLAASLGVFAADSARLPENADGCGTPNAMVLCYPVITGGAYAHRDSIFNLSGSQEMDERTQAWSVERYVTPRTCPAFLWQTVQDNCVPVENSLCMARALRAAGVSFELHLYPKGAHGLALATAESGTADAHVSTWLPLALDFLRAQGCGTDY